MYYFVTSWYGDQGKWASPNKYWYYEQRKMEFDDSVNQVKMFTLTNNHCELLVLNYYPQLRNFMHRQGIYAVPYHNFFDELQGIDSNLIRKISFRDLNWPQGTDFRYTPFNVWAFKDEEVLAYIEFTDEGNLNIIDWQLNGRTDHTYIFDDRGFLSSIRYYTADGNEWYQDYFDLAGQKQFRQYFNGQGVDIFPGANCDFAKQHYQDMDEVLAERIQVFSQRHLSPKDTVVVTANKRHNDLFVGRVPAKLVLSFFNNRYNLTDEDQLTKLLDQVDLAVAASTKEAAQLKRLAPVTQVVEVTPFDTRLEIGKSQQTEYLKLLYWLGNQTDEEIVEALAALVALATKFPKLALKFASYRSEEERIKTLVENYLAENDLEEEFCFGEPKFDPTDIDNLELEQKEVKVIDFLEVKSERDLVSELEFTRLIVDLGSEPDLFLQIAGISAGIPQINKVPSTYIEAGKNGLVVADIAGLTQAVTYYFDGLKNWNRAMMYAVNKIMDYTSGKLVAKWKELLGD